MFILKYMILALAEVIDIVLLSYMIIIFTRAVISWVNPDPYNQIVIFLYRVTEPVLEPIRRRLPFRNVGLDIAPVIVILIIIFLRLFLIPTMQHLAQLI